MTITTIEEVAERLERVIALYIEFKQLRDVTQEIAKAETLIAKVLEAAKAKPCRIDPMMVVDSLDKLQQPLIAVLSDFDTFVDNVNTEFDELAFEVDF